jgi:hypothetical protein
VAAGKEEDVGTPAGAELLVVGDMAQYIAVFHDMRVVAASLMVHLKSHLQQVGSV